MRLKSDSFLFIPFKVGFKNIVLGEIEQNGELSHRSSLSIRKSKGVCLLGVLSVLCI
jgi:hypothetical protein